MASAKAAVVTWLPAPAYGPTSVQKGQEQPQKHNGHNHNTLIQLVSTFVNFVPSW
jgi:hypothetical protein